MNKISILFLCLTIYAVCAEPLRNRPQQSRQFSRQEVTTTEQEDTTDSTSYPQTSPSSSGPYVPSGWKPSGQLLVLPSRQQQQYGPPQQYGAPTTEYGAPDDDVVSSTAEASDSSDSNETTDEPDSENVNVEDGPSQVQGSFNVQPQQQQQPGYFVQLADGSIQRLLYVSTGNNVIGAKLQAQPVVQAQPLLVQPFYVPQTVSYSSQYQSW